MSARCRKSCEGAGEFPAHVSNVFGVRRHWWEINWRCLDGIFFSLFLCKRDTSSAIHMEATVVEMFVRTYQILNGIMVFGDFLNTTTHVSERIKCGRDSI